MALAHWLPRQHVAHWLPHRHVARWLPQAQLKRCFALLYTYGLGGRSPGTNTSQWPSFGTFVAKFATTVSESSIILSVTVAGEQTTPPPNKCIIAVDARDIVVDAVRSARNTTPHHATPHHTTPTMCKRLSTCHAM